ncbi:MAG: hypothetical protein QXF52_02840 [Thermoproteota archaeon]
MASQKIVRIGIGGTATTVREEVRDTFIAPRSPWLGIIKKDFRIASRSPSYFTILVMPIVQTVILSFSMGHYYSNLNEITNELLPFSLLPLLLISSSMILLLPPMLLTTESIAYSYAGSLPLKKKTLILAKIILSSILYLISFLVYLLMMLINAPSFMYILILFGGVLIFSIVASLIFETLLLSRMFGKTIPSGNLYLKFYYYILPMIIGLVIMTVPIIVYSVTLFLTASSILSMISLCAASVSEFGIASLFLIRKK